MALIYDDDGGSAAPGEAIPKWESFVAIGDSFSEGLVDLPETGAANTEGAAGGGVHANRAGAYETTVPYVGWADRLAWAMHRRRLGAGLGPLRYANLAIRGYRLHQILSEQLEPALEMRPQLLSLVGGGNDLLHVRTDPRDLALELEGAVVRAREAGADVLLCTGVDPVNSPFMRRSRGPVAVFNSYLWSVARRNGCYVLDQWGIPGLYQWAVWAPDRIHLRSRGHEYVAQAALEALGLGSDSYEWARDPGREPHRSAVARAAANATWLRDHAGPWLSRRLHGTSTGDSITAKRPRLEALESPDSA